MRSQLLPCPEGAPPRAGVPLQSRGAVQPGALYIARPADAQLVEALRAGRTAVVLGPRFSGKSSLRARAMRALQAGGDGDGGPADTPPIRCASIEARSLQAASSGAAYQALCAALARELRLPAIGAFWQRHAEVPPADRFRRYVQEEVVTAEAKTVLLLDDLDALEALPLEVAAVLAALQQVQESQAAGALTLGIFSCLPLARLVSGSLPAGLRDAVTLLLPDFARDQLAALGPALAALVREGESVDGWLDAVFAWTGGHPQLTLHLCQQLVARAPAPPGAGAVGGELELSERVDRLVHTLFLAADEPLPADPCLREMAQAYARSPQAAALLALYRRLLSGQPVTPDPLDELQRELRLCGLSTQVVDAAGTPRLRPRCRLLAARLGEDWAREQEVRLILREALAREERADPRSVGAGLLRGSSLKTAQAWARKNPEALAPCEIRVLLASLEAARSEVEAKHQSSAAALQRELRDKALTRLPGDPAQPLAAAARDRPLPPRLWAVPLVALALLLGLSLVALGSAHRRLARLEHAAREATARAARAEQSLHPPPLAPAPAPSGGSGAGSPSAPTPPALAAPAQSAGSGVGSVSAPPSPVVAAPTPSAGSGVGRPSLRPAPVVAAPAPSGGSGSSGPSPRPLPLARTAEPRTALRATPSRRTASHERWLCPDPQRPR